jgi:ADP-ribose pyrophosphatase
MTMRDDSQEVALSGYRRLMRQRPDWFSNNPRGGIVILTSDTDVEQARTQARQFRAARGWSIEDLRAGLLAQDPYMTIVRDPVRFPDGSLGLYNRVIEGTPVAVLPLLAGRPVMIKVFRHGLRDWSLEFPRGACEGGETPEQGAARELAEEIGATARTLIPLGLFTPGGSSLSIRARLFAAEIATVGTSDRAEGIEEIQVFDVATLEHKISSSEIIDGFSLALLARARLANLL